MKTELILNSGGSVFDIGSICGGNIRLEYEKSGKPSVLEFSVVGGLIENEPEINEGDSVSFRADGTDMFLGYVFTKTVTKDNVTRIKAYDQLRYLKNKDTYIYSGRTASSLLRLILADFKLKPGIIEETGYVLPDRIEANQSLFDIILTATELTKMATGKDFVLYDDFGSICYRDIDNMELPLLAKTEMDGLIDFSLETSIDRDTYNRVKLFLNRESALCYSAESSETIDRWGVLQYTRILTKKEQNTAAAMGDGAGGILARKNRKSVLLTLEDMGDPTVRAGSRIWVSIDGGEKIAKTAVVTRAVHIFENGLHRMKLSLDLGG